MVNKLEYYQKVYFSSSDHPFFGNPSVQVWISWLVCACFLLHWSIFSNTDQLVAPAVCLPLALIMIFFHWESECSWRHSILNTATFDTSFPFFIPGDIRLSDHVPNFHLPIAQSQRQFCSSIRWQPVLELIRSVFLNYEVKSHNDYLRFDFHSCIFSWSGCISFRKQKLFCWFRYNF